ncbi:MAG: glycoside hydrolase/phage tail family protein [Rhodoplanes sp.]|uniref:baseplate multidomain protein megatron n=1 Tax=Rhodoplanes sp. TaxID=1968906 RepID=UPI0017FD21DE|nr:glycoside hydrolase/phage tail family protein [Rhodoplanes sp.]NVO17971.1 glycoside hydrolase/phage tail family protein [Rhodoplanes sp.]
MASLVLSVAGGALGGALFGPLGAIAGRIAGGLIGISIDHALLGGSSERRLEGPRLADLDVMASTEGAPIPRVYGRARLSGQVIWATPIIEVATTTEESSGGKGTGSSGGTTTITTTYTYFADFAVGVCEGPIGRVGRIWADGSLLDLDGLTVRTWPGDEAQAADPLIVARQGADGTPAYRGLAYVVFERLPLAPYGNRIPQLAFEVMRPVGALERMVRAVTLIPGTTEFGYEPSTVVRQLGPGQTGAENRHVTSTPSDVEAALDDLQAACPNLAEVAVVVAWFGTDLRAQACEIAPAIDSAAKQTHPATWSVAGRTRDSARVVSQVDGRPAYGGTPSDSSVRNLIAELKARGLRVTLYPFVMMDIPAGSGRPDPWTGAASQPPYPWRGRITCDPAPGRPGSPDGNAAAQAQVDAFFGTGAPAAWGFRRMVLHYASLAAAAGGVDTFLIGSELVGLTRVRSASGVYPAVTALAALAAEVKAMLPGASITYGADWTEYGAHVVDSGATEVRFPLDALWASPAIDAVGIDWYAPLADWRDTADHLDRALTDDIHDRAYLAANLRAGEGFDWYYANDAARAAQARSPITDGLGKPWMFRQKDLWSFWANPHHERVGGVELASPTAWVPQGKPIRITEVGCPAVDKGANQPSVFPDPKSSESGLPRFSTGERDDLIQRRVLEAVLTSFDPAFGATTTSNPVSSVYGGRMVDPSAITLWTWDARPWPVFPAASDVWSDAPNWQTGHWLSGRLGACPLDGLVDTMLADAGVTGCDAGRLGGGLDGYVIDRPMAPRAAIEPLAAAFAFDAVADGAALVFRPRGGAPVAELTDDDLVWPERGAPARLVRAQETELPAAVALGFSDIAADYRRAAVQSRRLVGGATRILQADLAAVMERAEAERRVEIRLQDVWAGRETASFAVPPSRLGLAPGDVVALTLSGRRRLLEIRELVDSGARSVTAQSIDPEVFALPLPARSRVAPVLPDARGPAAVAVLDLPTLPSDTVPVLARIAVLADPWPGPMAVWRSFDGATFERIAVVAAPAVIGETLDPVPAGPTGRFDRTMGFRVKLHGGALAAVSDAALLAGANAAVLQQADGTCEVFQFATAELVDVRTYRLSRLLRGQAGSERAMAAPLAAGATFVKLDDVLLPVARGLDLLGRAMTLRVVAADRHHGDPSAVTVTLTPQPTALRPLAPVHLRARRTDAGVLISWIRRTRRDGDSWNAIDVPLGEDAEAYVVDILSGTTVVRTLATPTPGVLYAAAAELADFGAAQTSLSVRAVQLSATVGRGFAAQATLTV